MTEAERIEKDAEAFINKNVFGDPKYITTVSPKGCYIAGATHEHERLQQLIKEKDEWIRKTSEAIDNAWGAYNMSEEKLESAQELNQELVRCVAEMTEQIKALGYYPECLTQEIESLINKSK